jgi:hypothetical protein
MLLLSTFKRLAPILLALFGILRVAVTSDASLTIHEAWTEPVLLEGSTLNTTRVPGIRATDLLEHSLEQPSLDPRQNCYSPNTICRCKLRIEPRAHSAQILTKTMC